MITEIERKQLKMLFQGHYTEEISKILIKKKKYNRNGNPYSSQYIRMVFQGARQNTDIESAIWELASLKKKLIEQKNSQKKHLFE